jgi:hypothetical protein
MVTKHKYTTESIRNLEWLAALQSSPLQNTTVDHAQQHIRSSILELCSFGKRRLVLQSPKFGLRNLLH